MSISHTIRMLLDIQDKNIIFEGDCIYEGTRKGHTCRYAEGTLTYVPTQCENCVIENEHYTVIKNGTKISTIVLPNDGVKKTYLKLKKQRFQCRHCQSTFIAKTPLVDEGCFISKHTWAQAIIKSAEAKSLKDIARGCKISTSSVQRGIDRERKRLHTYNRKLPEHLSFDEFKYAKGTMAFIYTDAALGEILDILPQRNGRTIREHFINFYPLKQRKKVKTVTIDMNASYVNIIKELFPHADIIIDRFHIVQLMTRSMNKTRVNIMNGFNTSRGEDLKKYRRIKGYWRLLLKSSKDLSSTEYRYYRLFGQQASQTVVDTILDYSPDLRANYQLYQQLLTAFNKKDYEYLEEILNEKKDLNISSYIRTSLKTLRKHLPYIKNSFAYPFNNGRIEGINNKIKVLNRVAYGYRNFYNYKYRILLHFKYKAVDPQKKQEQNKTHASAA